MPQHSRADRAARPARRRAIACLLPLLAVTACGSRLSQSTLVALNDGTGRQPSSTMGTTTGSNPAAGTTGGAVGSGTAGRTHTGITGTSGTIGATGAGGAATSTGGGGASSGSATTTTGPGSGVPAGTSSTGGADFKSDGKPITICSVSELSGPAGAALSQGVNGVQAWTADVNARGGVRGHKINLIVKDSQSDPQNALAQARDCVENQGAVALVASMSPLTNTGFRPYLESKGVPAIGGECGSVAWNQSPVFFNQCYSVDTGFWSIPAEAAKAGASNKNFAFLYCQEAATCSQAKTAIVDNGYAAQNGLTVAYSKQISLTQLDFTSECSAMKTAQVTTVDIVSDPATLSRLGQSCSRQGFNPIYVQTQATVAADTQTKPGLANVRIVLPAFPFCCLTGTAAKNATYQRYVTAYRRYGGSSAPGPAATDGFSAALLFERFVNEVAKSSPSITSAAMIKAASGIRNETLGGLAPPINLTTGKNTPDSRCWFTAVAKDAGAWQSPAGLTTTCRR